MVLILKIKTDQMLQSAEDEVKEIKDDITNLGKNMLDGLKNLNPIKHL